MKLLEMSISAGVLILLLALLRTWDFWNLPKRTVRILWMVVLARLLLPASLPVRGGIAAPVLCLLQKMRGMLQNPGSTYGKTLSGDVPEAASFGMEAHAADGFWQQAICLIWMAGMICFGIYFARSFLKEYRLLAKALPLDTVLEYAPDANAASEGMLDIPLEDPSDTLPESASDTPPEGFPESESPAYARILECCKAASRITGVRLESGTRRLLVHDQIRSPLVFKAVRQQIVLPKSMLHLEPGQLRHMLAHEMIHIKRRDNLWKLAATAAVCLHWFNPLVWLMYLLFAQDLELSCDEEVLALYGSHGRMEYAMTLLTLAQSQKKTILFSSGFGKNRAKERIVAIMKFKNLSGIGILCSVMLIAGASSVFATSGNAQNAAKQPVQAEAPFDGEKNLVSYTLAETADGKESIAESRMAEVTEAAKSRMAEVTEDAETRTAGDGKEAAKSGAQEPTGTEIIDISLDPDASEPEAPATDHLETIRMDFSAVDWPAICPKEGESKIKIYDCDVDENGVVHVKGLAKELTQEEQIWTP